MTKELITNSGKKKQKKHNNESLFTKTINKKKTTMHQMTLNFLKINSFVKKIANPLNFNGKTKNFKEKCEPRTPEVKIRHCHVISGQFYRKQAKELIF